MKKVIFKEKEESFGEILIYGNCFYPVTLLNKAYFFSFLVHMRDPNNQLHIIKNLKIAVNNIITHPPQPGAIRKLLNDVVSVSQPAEGLVANVITAGDYDLNISGM